MTQPTSSPSPSPQSPMTAQSDLLTSLVNPQVPYPWEPSDPATETYFARAAAELDEPLIEEAIAAGWQRFSTQLDSQWGSDPALAASVAQALTAQFQGRLPREVLQTIAATATALAQNGLSLIDQLVGCASAVLPTWDRDDLAVLARPLAYALRDGHREMVDLNLRTTPQADWNRLSDIEKARLSLAIASIALKAAAAEAS